jgi:hypothetical protein
MRICATVKRDGQVAGLKTGLCCLQEDKQQQV